MIPHQILNFIIIALRFSFFFSLKSVKVFPIRTLIYIRNTNSQDKLIEFFDPFFDPWEEWNYIQTNKQNFIKNSQHSKAAPVEKHIIKRIIHRVIEQKILKTIFVFFANSEIGRTEIFYFFFFLILHLIPF